MAVFGCPDDPSQPVSGRTKISYAINFNLMTGYGSGGGDTYGRGGTTSVAADNSPANTVLLFECQGVQGSGGGLGVLLGQNPPESVSSSGNGALTPGCNTFDVQGAYCSATYATGYIGGYPLHTSTKDADGIHTGGANYIALDSHAKFLKPANVSGGANATAATNPEQHDTSNEGNEHAAGTGSMTEDTTADGGTNSSTVALTFSAI